MDYSAKNKDYTGARNVIAYFADGQFTPRSVALVFGPHGKHAEMMAVFESDFWTRETVGLWKRAIAAHQKHRKATREVKATERTEIRKPEKPAPKFRKGTTKKAQ